jgi:hypothetical protein
VSCRGTRMLPPWCAALIRLSTHRSRTLSSCPCPGTHSLSTHRSRTLSSCPCPGTGNGGHHGRRAVQPRAFGTRGLGPVWVVSRGGTKRNLQQHRNTSINPPHKGDGGSPGHGSFRLGLKAATQATKQRHNAVIAPMPWGVGVGGCFVEVHAHRRGVHPSINRRTWYSTGISTEATGPVPLYLPHPRPEAFTHRAKSI